MQTTRLERYLLLFVPPFLLMLLDMCLLLAYVGLEFWPSQKSLKT